jgi:hypothetical protein
MRFHAVPIHIIHAGSRGGAPAFDQTFAAGEAPENMAGAHRAPAIFSRLLSDE